MTSKMCFGNIFSQKGVSLAALLFSLAFLETSGSSASLDAKIIRNFTDVEIKSLEPNATAQQPRQFQGRHRLKMLFPLLLRISTKLTQVVPMAMAAVGLTFTMALFAKKAFVISVVAFVMMLYQNYKKRRTKDINNEDDTYHFVIDNKHFVPYHHVPAIRHKTTYPHGVKFYYNDGYDSDR